MSHTGPDMIKSKPNVFNKNLGDFYNNKFPDQKKKAFVKKTVSWSIWRHYHNQV